MKNCFIVFFAVCISCLLLFVIGNNKNCVRNKGFMFAELASETPFNAKSVGEVRIRNRLRLNKFYRACN